MSAPSAGEGQALLFLFLDGLGLGSADPERNPLAAARTPVLREVSGAAWTQEAPARRGAQRVFRALDATLGHAGLPQSATGQTALLTGHNGADVMGGHYGPWPGPTLRRVLAGGGLFHRASAGGGAWLANAYPPPFFEALERGRIRLGAAPWAARAAGVPLRDVDHYRRGEAVSVDLHGEALQAFGAALPLREPRAAGADLARAAGATTFTYLDLWWTDRLGHQRDHGGAVAYLERFDAFLGGVLDAAPKHLTVLVTSDHGNVEELSHGRHTRAAVPLLALGPAAARLGRAETLLDVAPAVLRGWGETA